MKSKIDQNLDSFKKIIAESKSFGEIFNMLVEKLGYKYSWGLRQLIHRKCKEYSIDCSHMNYPTTKDGWVSWLTDLSLDNASPHFCFDSDCIPQPEYIFNPCSRIFSEAFISLSNLEPQLGQVHSLSLSVRF